MKGIEIRKSIERQKVFGLGICLVNEQPKKYYKNACLFLGFHILFWLFEFRLLYSYKN